MKKKTTKKTAWLMLAGSTMMTLSTAACRDYFVVSDESGLDGKDGSPTNEGAPPSSSQTDGGDGGSDANGSARSPCATPPATMLFCEDFDVGALGARWDQKNLSFGGLDMNVSVSSPSSFRMLLAARGSDTTDYLGKKLTTTATSNLQLDLDLRIEREADVYPVGFFFGGPHSVVLNLDGYVNEASGSTNFGGHKYTATFPAGVWRHVSIRVRRDQTPPAQPSVEMFVDGVSALPVTTLQNPGDVIRTSNVTLAVGLYYAPNNTAWEGRFDNVIVTTF